jgi:hypothetical protein
MSGFSSQSPQQFFLGLRKQRAGALVEVVRRQDVSRQLLNAGHVVALSLTSPQP